MTMKDLNVEKTQKLLSRIMEFELAGVVRYTHYSLMVTGPNRLPIVAFMKAQANESLLHAQQAGEILTGLGGHPTQQIAPIDESHQHSVQAILEESLAHERRALKLYKELLDVVENRSVYLEEFARTQIAQEELHGLELRKMLRDIGVSEPVPGAHDVFARGHGDDARAEKSHEKKRDKKHEKKHAKHEHDDVVKNGVDESELARMQKREKREKKDETAEKERGKNGVLISKGASSKAASSKSASSKSASSKSASSKGASSKGARAR